MNDAWECQRDREQGVAGSKLNYKILRHIQQIRTSRTTGRLLLAIGQWVIVQADGKCTLSAKSQCLKLIALELTLIGLCKCIRRGDSILKMLRFSGDADTEGTVYR